MKLVIVTQYKENYGAHDWDGQGECPQYWKFKGGETYVINVSLDQAQDPAFYDAVYECIVHSSDYSEEYIVSETLVDDVDYVESSFVEEWEQPICCSLINNPQLFEKPTLVCEQYIKEFEGPIVGVRRWDQDRDGRENYTVVETKKVA